MRFKHFKPAPPFNEYHKGYVIFANNEKRYYVKMRKIGYDNCYSMSLVRYVYSTRLWHREHKLIPEGMTVDHIDNNKLEVISIFTFK